MHNKSKASLAAAALYCASSAIPAQTTEPATPAVTSGSSDQEVVEILVTARRKVEPVSDVPLSLSVFSSDDLVNKNVSTTADLVKITPGSNITGAGSNIHPFIVIRGASRATAGSATSTPSGVGVTSRIWAPPRADGAAVRMRFGN